MMGNRKSVLVVEDEMLIAIDLEVSLQELGWNVVGPVAQIDRALQLIGKEIVDVGLLDYNIGSDTSEEIALALLEKSVPVIFLSGIHFVNGQRGLSAARLLRNP